MKFLEVRDLDKSFVSHKKGSLVHAVDHISFYLEEGEFLGIVGESGCGKSTVAKLLMGLHRPDSGDILIHGKPCIYPYSRDVYRHIQMVFQMPKDSFDPRRTIGKVLDSVLGNFGTPTGERKKRSVELLEQVGLNESFLSKYPHEMSGGECQRAAIARAMAASPQILICDEITSALDVSVQAQIVDLIMGLKESGQFSVIFISHDLALVQGLCSRIIVMNDGQIVEEGEASEITNNPKEEYTRILMNSVLSVD
ncbi:MAG: ABC transporter ATP-binding protein [Lachnospiraceae bacterium]|nr:ABC transporter ATP-binding protein [Lachnospiraceae bacterium]MBR4754427.1 ABC transporter ATP-binding protein [Lachnospiraceae bacterium]MBR4807136.1 ABC transporter ATP-binding protein [Lachnospiraceae bacterium]